MSTAWLEIQKGNDPAPRAGSLLLSLMLSGNSACVASCSPIIRMQPVQIEIAP